MYYWIYEHADLVDGGHRFPPSLCQFASVGKIFIRPFPPAFLRREPALNDLVGYLLAALGSVRHPARP